jgi:hypothetical protein
MLTESEGLRSPVSISFASSSVSVPKPFDERPPWDENLELRFLYLDPSVLLRGPPLELPPERDGNSAGK